MVPLTPPHLTSALICHCLFVYLQIQLGHHSSSTPPLCSWIHHATHTQGCLLLAKRRLSILMNDGRFSCGTGCFLRSGGSGDCVPRPALGTSPWTSPGPLPDLRCPWQPPLLYCISGSQMSPGFVVKMLFAFLVSFFLLLWGDFQEGNLGNCHVYTANPKLES